MRRSPTAPGGAVGLWVGNWAWCALAVMPAVFLLFPFGTLPIPRLRPVLGLALAMPPLFALGIAIAPVRLHESPAVDNPFGIGALGPALDVGASILLLLLLALLLVSLGSMAWRLRGAVGDERRQLAWVLLGAGVLALQLPFEALASPSVTGMTSALFITVFCGCLGIAMVRHRLYEIDFILNRTLVYGTLTVCLLALYAAVVALVGTTLRDRNSSAASLVAAGVVAVVLAPLRGRLQRGVDRLLYGERRDPLAVMSQLGRRLERAAPEGEAATGDAAVAAATKLQPDVVVMDIQMPNLNGIDATREIVARSPHIGVLVLTMFEDDDSVFAAMRAGALGYLLKGSAPDDIARAIETVGSREAVFGPAIARRLIDFFATAPAAYPFPELTDREREVLDLLAEGRSNSDIARRFVLSAKTVRNHVSNIFTKLQVADRAQAIVRAREAGLGRKRPASG